MSVLAAIEVERAWRNLPFVPKMILKQYFILRQPSGRICRSLRRKGFPVIDRDFELEIERAKLLLARELQKKP